MSARKTERLLNLVICLLATRRYLTAGQIRDAVPGYPPDGPGGNDTAFRRMFERDKEELRELGIPLETGSHSVWDDEVGYRIARRHYALPEITLAPDEAAALGLAARLWQSAGLAHAASGALLKLRAAGIDTGGELGAGLEPRVEAAEPAFPALFEAVRSRRPVEFDYRRSGVGAAARRRVEPWGVVSWRGRWYAVGRDRDRQAARVFRLSRVVGPVRPAGPAGSVEVPAGVDLRAAVAAYDDVPAGRLAVLRVRAGAAAELRRGAVAERAGAGWDELTVAFAEPERLADRVVGFGADVVVVDPPDARAAALSRLRAVAAEPSPA